MKHFGNHHSVQTFSGTPAWTRIIPLSLLTLIFLSSLGELVLSAHIRARLSDLNTTSRSTNVRFSYLLGVAVASTITSLIWLVTTAVKRWSQRINHLRDILIGVAIYFIVWLVAAALLEDSVGGLSTRQCFIIGFDSCGEFQGARALAWITTIFMLLTALVSYLGWRKIQRSMDFGHHNMNLQTHA